MPSRICNKYVLKHRARARFSVACRNSLLTPLFAFFLTWISRTYSTELL